MTSQAGQVEVKVVDHAGTILINRPAHRNALTRPMVQQIGAALDDLYFEKRVRAIVLTGAGATFSVGLDLAESQAAEPLSPAQETADAAFHNEKEWGEEAGELRDVLVRMFEITKPIIAAVNGLALSFGASLVAASDIVVAAETAEIGVPDARQGLVAGLAAPLLCHRIGAGHTARMLFTGTQLSALDAVRLGLFHELVPVDKVWARAMQIAADCALGAPQAVQLTKRLLHETSGDQLATQLSAGAVMRATSRTTAAAKEGVAADLENRAPNWDD